MNQIHHYTTIENLALILKNKTLRFTRLDLVDDRLEGDNFGIYNPLKYIFASCWTKDERENIALWKMYATIDLGVRISLNLDDNIFNQYPIFMPSLLHAFYSQNGQINAQFDNILAKQDNTINNEICCKSALRPDQFSNKDYFILPWMSEIQPENVTYDDDYLVKYRNALTMENGSYVIDNGKIKFGTYKNTYWEFQKETRFIIQTQPGGGEEKNFLGRNFLNKDIETLFIDVDLNIDAINNMTITYAPKINETQRLIVRALTNEFPAVTLKESELKNIIRH